MLQIAARLEPKPRAVLDVGCGTGSLLRMAAVRFQDARLTGVDPAEQMVRMTAASLAAYSRVQLACAPAERLPFEDAEFDLVLSTNSFHHWADQRAGIREIGRVLGPSGCLVVADPFALGWLRMWALLAGKRERLWTRPEVEATLRAAGLEALGWETIFRVGPVPFIHAATAKKVTAQATTHGVCGRRPPRPLPN